MTVSAGYVELMYERLRKGDPPFNTMSAEQRAELLATLTPDADRAIEIERHAWRTRNHRQPTEKSDV